MQFESAFCQSGDDEWQQSMIMERAILLIRQLWFGAREASMGPASLIVEPGGEMVMFLDGPDAAVDAVIAEAAGRGAYITATSLSRPHDLPERLAEAGFRPVLRQAAYVWDGQGVAAAPAPTPPPVRRGLFGLLGGRRQLPGVVVRQIDAAELPAWNAICWRAFGARGNEADALHEKRHAFRTMGTSARWYLATVGGRPAGTAILHQTPDLGQVLAVGTDPGSRGQGVATAVMRRLVQDWQQDGSGFLFLDTTPGSPAEQLYLRIGFRQAYVREVYAPHLLDATRYVR
ncbi:MAG: family acetyltransferase [Firmicutes bacterium]|nr:family acetyltransferase [Bacillota bacterium]